MPRELKNANITHVSYVDKAANQKRFFLTKSDGKPTFEKQVKIVSKSDEQQLVYGIVYEPDVEDSQGDFMTAAEIEKAAHNFLKDARNIDTQHDFQSGVGEVVESYVAPADLEIEGESIAKGSWILVTKASDEIWEEIKKGDITGYSMAGTAEAIEKTDKKPFTKSDDDEVRGFLHAMKSFFSREKVEKGAVRERYERNKKQRDFWSAMDSFESTIRSYNWQTDSFEFEADADKVREAIQDLSDILQEVLLQEDIMKAIGKPPEQILKAGKKISSANMDKINAAIDALQGLKTEVEGEEVEVTKEELQGIVDSAIQKAMEPVNTRLTTLEKGEEPPAAGTGNEDIAKTVEDAVAKAVAPINERLEAVEKARGISKAAEQPPQAQEVKKSIWEGVL